MKIDLLLTQDGAQVILTPDDTAFEKDALAALHTMTLVNITKGEVWGKTQGGFYRQFDERPNKQSTLLVLRKPDTEPSK